MTDRPPSAARWILTRVAIITGSTIAIGILVALLLRIHSAKAVCNILFVLGGILVFLGFLDVLNSKARLIDYTYQLARSAGSMSLEQRTRNDIGEIHQSYVGLMLLALSGVLTIGVGVAVWKIIG
jgi:phosphoglycerol transferase MdoB-like AlkP superfamily enzyme